MAAILVDPIVITRAGVTNAGTLMSNASDNYHVKNDGSVALVFQNGATAGTVTVTIFKTVDGQSVTNRTITVPANATVFAGYYDADTYNQVGGTENGRMRLTASGSATIRLFAID